METSTSQESSLIKVKSATIHELIKNQKKKLDFGNGQLYREGNEYFLKVNNFVHNLKTTNFGKMKYKESVSYFFIEQSNENNVLVLSISLIDNSDQLIQQFDGKLSNIAVVNSLTDLQSESPLLKRVNYVWPQYEKKTVQSSGSAVTKISRQFGGLIGSLSGLISKPIENIGKTADTKKQELYQSQLKNETKTKWQTVKEKASQLNDGLSQSLKPVSEGAKNVTSSIGHSFNHSNNSIIKAIRDFGQKTKKALNQGYKQGMGINPENQSVLQQSDSYIGQVAK